MRMLFPAPPLPPDLPPPGPMEQILAVIVLLGLILLALPEKWREVIKRLFGGHREDNS